MAWRRFLLSNDPIHSAAAGGDLRLHVTRAPSHSSSHQTRLICFQRFNTYGVSRTRLMRSQ
ncbi:hypothetical protein ABG768_003135, partial [Culter alburnus]